MWAPSPPHLGVAVEADRDVVSGLEMGRFGRGKIALYGREADALRGHLGGVIFSTSDLLEVHRSDTLNWARAEFTESRVVESYGQFGQRLWLFVPGEEMLWAQ